MSSGILMLECNSSCKIPGLQNPCSSHIHSPFSCPRAFCTRTGNTWQLSWEENQTLAAGILDLSSVILVWREKKKVTNITGFCPITNTDYLLVLCRVSDPWRMDLTFGHTYQLDWVGPWRMSVMPSRVQQQWYTAKMLWRRAGFNCKKVIIRFSWQFIIITVLSYSVHQQSPALLLSFPISVCHQVTSHWHRPSHPITMTDHIDTNHLILSWHTTLTQTISSCHHAGKYHHKPSHPVTMTDHTDTNQLILSPWSTMMSMTQTNSFCHYDGPHWHKPSRPVTMTDHNDGGTNHPILSQWWPTLTQTISYCRHDGPRW